LPRAAPDGFSPQSAAADGADFHNELNDSGETEAPLVAPVDLDEGWTSIDVELDRDCEYSDDMLKDIETVVARHYPRKVKHRRLSWPLSRLQSGILALVIMDSVLVGWRADFVRALPQTASFYAGIGMPVNLRGLDFEKITTATGERENAPILMVEGNIVNDASKTLDVPRLKFAVRNAERQEIYSWTAVPPRATLPPGEIVAFRTLLDSPPPDAHDVLVRFVNHYDVIAGAR
jgi:hypothetical protein